MLLVLLLLLAATAAAAAAGVSPARILTWSVDPGTAGSEAALLFFSCFCCYCSLGPAAWCLQLLLQGGDGCAIAAMVWVRWTLGSTVKLVESLGSVTSTLGSNVKLVESLGSVTSTRGLSCV